MNDKVLVGVLCGLSFVSLNTGCASQSAGNDAGTPSASGPRVVAPPLQAANDAKAAQLDRSNPSNILFWSPQRQLFGYKNIDQIYPTRRVLAGDSVHRLKVEANGSSERLLNLTYQVDGQEFRIADFIRTYRTTGLMVVQNNQIQLENYSLGNTPQTRWMSFSIAKSVTAMLIGAAIKDGFILSVDEPVTTYLPRLKNSAYGHTTIKDLLNMASGVAWNEDYTDPDSDVSHAGGLNGIALFEYLGKLPTAAPPGTKFNYSTGETNLVGALLRAAIGNNAASYLQQKIWQSFGMQDDANWMLDQPAGGEQGGCCISATLRDYVRIGLFAMRNGRNAKGQSPLPDGWMQESTRPSAAYPGYGYLWWLSDDGWYSARGIFGQMIVVDAQANLVIAMHSAWPKAVGETLSAHRAGVVQAIRNHLSE